MCSLDALTVKLVSNTIVRSCEIFVVALLYLDGLRVLRIGFFVSKAFVTALMFTSVLWNFVGPRGQLRWVTLYSFVSGVLRGSNLHRREPTDCLNCPIGGISPASRRVTHFSATRADHCERVVHGCEHQSLRVKECFRLRQRLHSGILGCHYTVEKLPCQYFWSLQGRLAQKCRYPSMVGAEARVATRGTTQSLTTRVAVTRASKQLIRPDLLHPSCGTKDFLTDAERRTPKPPNGGTPQENTPRSDPHQRAHDGGDRGSTPRQRAGCQHTQAVHQAGGGSGHHSRQFGEDH